MAEQDPLSDSQSLLQDTLGRPVASATARAALTRAAAMVRNHCGWHITRQTVTSQVQRVDRRSTRLFLPTLYLVSVDAVVVDGVTLVEGTDFAWTDWGELVYPAGRAWPTSMGSVVVSYTHGVADPSDWLDTARGVTAAVAGSLVGNPLRHQSESTGNESWTDPAVAQAALTDALKDELSPLTLDRL